MWYNEIAQTLREEGLLRSGEEPCVFTNGHIIVLVYVDDILVISQRNQRAEVEKLITFLQGKYELRKRSSNGISAYALSETDPTARSIYVKTPI